MYLRNIAISNYHTFTYHPQLTLTKGMEFDTDPYTSNVNILIWPNGSGKSNFLDLIGLLCNFHSKESSPLTKGGAEGGGIKKHHWFESYPTTVIAQRVVWWADESHMITIQYNLDEMTYKIVHPPYQGGIKGGSWENDNIGPTKSTSLPGTRNPELVTNFNYHFLTTSRIPSPHQRSTTTTNCARDYLGLIYNPNNLSYMTASWAIRKRDDLWSGEQSILWMIEEIVWSDHHGGIVLIDEPELHLHPQYQVQLGAILELLSQRQNIQIIIATHSPSFIDEHNIVNVFRFAPRDGHTHIINPVSFAGQELSKIKQILTTTNAAKLFFADIIIMVEWDTDEYFLDKYIHHYFTQHNIQSRRYNYEILNIAGKWSLRAWRKFCEQFQIHWSFIGDWDNVINSQFGAQIEQIKSQIPRRKQWHKLTKSQHYQALIQEISDHHPQLEQQLQDMVDRDSNRHIYTLRHGDLEAYLGMWDKWLWETIDRYNKHFSQRATNSNYSHYRNDLNTILSKIFHVKSD